MHRAPSPAARLPRLVPSFLVVLAPGVLQAVALGPVGERYCSAVPNSTGLAARIDATGSAAVELDALTLTGAALPPSSVGYFLVSRDAGFSPNPSGVGNLCLSGAIGRYRSSVLTASPSGEVALGIDLTQVPFPSGPVATVAGETLRFQYWYRDVLPGGGATSNTSDGLAVTFHCSERPFPLRSYPTSSGAHGLELEDLDADGDLDAVVICAASGPASLHVLRNDGLGRYDETSVTTLASSSITAVGNGASIVLEDLDGDGHLDVAAALPTDRVAVLLGNGDGTFAAPNYVAVSGALASLSGGDVDGDGDVDLVLRRTQDATAAVLLNAGGTFQIAATWSIGPNSNGLALGDVDGDGRADAVTAHASGGLGLAVSSITVHRGLGGPTITSNSLPVRLGGPYAGVTLGDVDLDGLLDIVAPATNDLELDLYRGLGAGGFGAVESFATVGSPTSVKVADVDADGRQDLVATASFLSPMSVLLGQPGGTFAAAAGYASTHRAWEAEVGDIDGDGIVDVVATDLNAGAIMTIRGLGAGTFESRIDVVGEPDAASFFAADLDFDGRADLLTLHPSQPQLTVDFGVDDPATATKLRLTTVGRPLHAVVVDLDLDGRPDIAYTNALGEVHALDSTPAGFVPRLLVAPGVALGVLRAANLDADAAPELCVVRTTTNDVLVLDEVAGAYVQVSVQAAQGAIADVALVDVDRDGALDLVVASATPALGRAVVDVRRNLGNGAFGPVATQRVGARLSVLVAADLDGDGAPELVVDGDNLQGQDTLFVLWNDGAGAFAPPASMPLPGDPLGLAAADFDGDGRVDVAAVSRARGQLLLLRGRGAAGFAAVERYGLATAPLLLTSADFDGDGAPDLAVLMDVAGASVLLNQCP